jgi:beta-lactam-binding protein with PASTA domain
MGARNIVPLILLLIFVGILAAVGYIVYNIVQDVSKNTREKMERKNIAFTKDGMKVQVKEIKDEAYKDQTQRCVYSILFV